MTDYTQNTHQVLLQRMLAMVPATFDKRDTQPIPSALSPAAYIAAGLYIDLNQVQLQAAIQTASGEYLDNWAVLGGISRYQASAAVRLGVFNTSVPIGSRFSTINGADSIDFTVTAAVSGNQYQLTADTPGSIGNDYTGPILPITAIPGLTSAQITNILVPGDDTETDTELRARLILALTDRPFGGNIASYRTEIMEMDGVGAVQIYPVWDGGGTVKCSILGADYLPASPTLVEQVQNSIDPPPNQGLGLGLAPIGAKVTITAPSEAEISVSATLTMQSGYNVGQVQSAVESALEAYLLTVRQSWADNISSTGVAYAANIYLARVTAAIIGVTGIVNATNVAINGAAADISLPQTGEAQSVPVLGSVTLT